MAAILPWPQCVIQVLWRRYDVAGLQWVYKGFHDTHCCVEARGPCDRPVQDTLGFGKDVRTPQHKPNRSLCWNRNSWYYWVIGWTKNLGPSPQLLLLSPHPDCRLLWIDWISDPGPWWRHQMETFPALLAICAVNSPVPGEFPAQRTVTRSFDVFFDLCLNKRLSKQPWGWWFETLSGVPIMTSP